MAVSGEPFTKSAWNGFMTNLKHMAEFYFAQDVGYVFIFIGKVSISLLTTLSFYGLECAVGNSFNILPMIIIFFFSLLVCFIIVGLFNDAIIASLMSYAIDKELNGVAVFGNPEFHKRLDELANAHKGEGEETNNMI